MHISQVLGKKQTTISFEFFPPKNEEASEDLFRNIQELSQMNPAYVSVTYGAGGSTRDLTHDLVVKLQEQTGLTIVSHLTCVGSTKEEIRGILKRYEKSGIHNIMALRGDPPKGQSEFQKTENGFAFAGELVAFNKKRISANGDWCCWLSRRTSFYSQPLKRN